MRKKTTWLTGSLMFAFLLAAQPAVAQDVNDDDDYAEADDDDGFDLGLLGLLGLAGLAGLRKPREVHTHTTTTRTPPPTTGPGGTNRI